MQIFNYSTICLISLREIIYNTFAWIHMETLAKPISFSFMLHLHRFQIEIFNSRLQAKKNYDLSGQFLFDFIPHEEVAISWVRWIECQNFLQSHRDRNWIVPIVDIDRKLKTYAEIKGILFSHSYLSCWQFDKNLTWCISLQILVAQPIQHILSFQQSIPI